MLCIYSRYYPLNRKHSVKSINIEVIKKTVNYIKATIYSRNKKEITIAFYGGEPLLEFSLISDSVKFIKDEFRGWKIDIQITTNGTIITPKIIDFLVNNNVRTIISFDGP